MTTISNRLSRSMTVPQLLLEGDTGEFCCSLAIIVLNALTPFTRPVLVPFGIHCQRIQEILYVKTNSSDPSAQKYSTCMPAELPWSSTSTTPAPGSPSADVLIVALHKLQYVIHVHVPRCPDHTFYSHIRTHAFLLTPHCSVWYL